MSASELAAPAGSGWWWTCPKCGKRWGLVRKEVKERGHCAQCEVASWTPAHRRALAKICTTSLKGDMEGLKTAVEEAVPFISQNSRINEPGSSNPAPLTPATS
jgi:hypothetical protein